GRAVPDRDSQSRHTHGDRRHHPHRCRCEGQPALSDPEPGGHLGDGRPHHRHGGCDGAGTGGGERVVLVTASSQGQSAFVTVVVRQEAVAARLSQDSVALTGQGDTVRLSAVGLDRNGYPVAGAAFVWHSSSLCVATVDAVGLVTAGGGGSSAIIATLANGGRSDTAGV